MSVKQGLLALLAEEPMYGARLRAEFEARTGGTWPLNVGQVYTTLARLERDGLVKAAGAADDEGRISYRLTEAGRREVAQWWLSPVDRDSAPRDELAIKLALAVTSRRRRAAGRADTAHRDVATPPGPDPSQEARRRPGEGRRRWRRCRLAARAGEPGLLGRGGGPLARPRRGHAGPRRRANAAAAA